MGFTWILGVVIVHLEYLIFLAYVYTIMVALQGVFIFILYVALSKSVKDAVRKWWKIRVNESEFLSKHFGEKLKSSNAAVSYYCTTKCNLTHPVDFILLIIISIDV